jgi:hypothetical protein
MQWNRSQTIGMAAANCAYCKGLGLRIGVRAKPSPCNCVFRAIFRACLDHFRVCTERQGQYTSVFLERCRGAERKVFWAMTNEDYIADFLAVSRRHLSAFDYDLFRFHYLLGADWKLCCRRLKIDRGSFFHYSYRIQQRLGRAFVETRPYGLFPIDEYFGSVVHLRKPPVRALEPLPATPRALRPPLQHIA